jgi:hypothetical protein
MLTGGLIASFTIWSFSVELRPFHFDRLAYCKLYILSPFIYREYYLAHWLAYEAILKPTYINQEYYANLETREHLGHGIVRIPHVRQTTTRAFSQVFDVSRTH